MTWVKGGLTMIKNYFSVGEANHINNMNKEAQNVQLGSAVRTALMGDIGWKDDEKYYVDAVSGNDNNPGTSMDKPFKTIQKAVNVARWVPYTESIDTSRDRRKYIFIFPGQYNEQVLFSGYNISLVGLGQRSNGDYGVVINYDDAVAATAVIAFSGSGLELSNLCIQCSQALPIVFLDGVSDACHIHDCWIKGNAGKTPTFGICASIKNSLIENNIINGCAVGINVANGDWFNNSIIRRNKITNVTDGINLANGCIPTESEISENKVVGSTSSIVNGQATDVIITDNMVKPVESDAGSTSGNNTTLA